MRERAGPMQPDPRDGGFPVSFGFMTQMLLRKGLQENVWRRRWKVITITLSVTMRAGTSVEQGLGN